MKLIFISNHCAFVKCIQLYIEENDKSDHSSHGPKQRWMYGHVQVYGHINGFYSTNIWEKYFFYQIWTRKLVWNVSI